MTPRSAKARAGRPKSGKLIKCQICKREAYFRSSELLSGRGKYCSRKCYYTHLSISGGYNKTHGMSRTKEYETWCRIIARCENKRSADYVDYGGRGISICKRWRKSFSNFLTDMGKRPSNKHSIERIDVNGNYEPKNCVWATQDIQQNNRRVSIKIQFNNEIKSIAGWARELMVPYHQLYRKYRKNQLNLGDLHAKSNKTVS